MLKSKIKKNKFTKEELEKMTSIFIDVLTKRIEEKNKAYEKKEQKMKNEEFLTKVSRLQREFMELYEETGLVGISSEHFHIEATLFHELEKENLLEHISKELDEKVKSWRLEAMTPDGVKVIALEYVEAIEDKR